MHPSVNRLIDITSSLVAAQRWASFFWGGGYTLRSETKKKAKMALWVSPVDMQIIMCYPSLLIIKYILKQRGQQFGLASHNKARPGPARPSTAWFLQKSHASAEHCPRAHTLSGAPPFNYYSVITEATAGEKQPFGAEVTLKC